MQKKFRQPLGAGVEDKEISEPGAGAPIPEMVFFFDIGACEHEDGVEEEDERVE